MKGGLKGLQIALVLTTLTLASCAILVYLPKRASGFTTHSPIFIWGNFGFTASNGVVGGSGTSSDPYIIGGWDINASTAHGIHVQNTDVSFVVKDVFVHSGGTTYGGLVFDNVTNGQIKNVTSQGNSIGAVLQVKNFTMADCNISLSYSEGIHLEYSSEANFSRNNISQNLGTGFALWWSNNITFKGNSAFSNNDKGVWVYDSANTTIAANVVSSSRLYGIDIYESDRVNISGNELLQNRMGLLISSSTNMTISQNSFTDDGVVLDGDSLPHYNTHTITADNLVNGLPVYYYKDCADLVVNAVPLGQLLIVNCTNAKATGLSITRTDVGIEMVFVNSAFMANNSFSSNDFYDAAILRSSNLTMTDNDMRSNLLNGVFVWDSDNVTAARNSVFGNGDSGLNFLYSANITIIDNDMRGNFIGADLYACADATIANNSLFDGSYGVMLSSSNDVVVHHNNFVNNAKQAQDTGSGSNVWDSGYPNGGNYWSDYAGPDDCRGPLQDACPDPDGIGDIPHVIESDSRDNYPLMRPTRDISPPVVSITVPTKGQIFDVPSIPVNGTASDTSGSGLERVEIRLNGGQWTDANGTSLWNGTASLAVGSNTIEAKAWDMAGNPSPVASVTVSFAQSINTHPDASFIVDPTSGKTTTVFKFNASTSHDLETPSVSLEIRWDWENDGVWDTQWSTNKTAEHRFAAAGTYATRLAVRDEGGLVNETNVQIPVEAEDSSHAVFPWWPMVMIVAVVLVLVLSAILIMRRKRDAAKPPPQQSG